jgi:glycosyltransferase involved in cell wall biosynthesis
MRILHVIGDSDYGGGSRIITAVAAASQRAGHPTTVLTTVPRFQAVLRAEGVGVLDRDWVRRRPNPWVDLRGVLALAAHLRADDVDVVHTHTTRGGLLGRLAARLAGVDVVIHTAHGFAVAEDDPAWKQWAYFAVERRAARWGHYLVAVSEHHGRWGRDVGLRPRVELRVIANGVPDPWAETPGPTGPAASPPLVLHFGRLAQGKGIDVLLHAFRDLSAAWPDPEAPRLVVAGDGPLLAPGQDQARDLGIDDRVDWLGHRDDLPALLAAARVVVLPSLREGLSLAVLETMAAGRPIVATSLGGNVEALDGGRCGRLVPAGDVAALTAALRAVLDDPAGAEAMGAAARQHYVDTYRLDRMVGRYLALYEEALDAVRRTVARPADSPWPSAPPHAAAQTTRGPR